MLGTFVITSKSFKPYCPPHPRWGFREFLYFLLFFSFIVGFNFKLCLGLLKLFLSTGFIFVYSRSLDTTSNIFAGMVLVVQTKIKNTIKLKP
jgi:hypothetical protein